MGPGEIGGCRSHERFAERARGAPRPAAARSARAARHGPARRVRRARTRDGAAPVQPGSHDQRRGLPQEAVRAGQRLAVRGSQHANRGQVAVAGYPRAGHVLRREQEPGDLNRRRAGTERRRRRSAREARGAAHAAGAQEADAGASRARRRGGLPRGARFKPPVLRPGSGAGSGPFKAPLRPAQVHAAVEANERPRVFRQVARSQRGSIRGEGCHGGAGDRARRVGRDPGGALVRADDPAARHRPEPEEPHGGELRQVRERRRGGDVRAREGGERR